MPDESLVNDTKIGQMIWAKHDRDARPLQSGGIGGDSGLDVPTELRRLRQVDSHLPALVLQALQQRDHTLHRPCGQRRHTEQCFVGGRLQVFGKPLRKLFTTHKSGGSFLYGVTIQIRNSG